MIKIKRYERTKQTHFVLNNRSSFAIFFVGSNFLIVPAGLIRSVNCVPPLRSRPSESGKLRKTNTLPIARARIRASQPCDLVIVVPLI